MSIIETHELGKRYGRTQALVDCTLTLPEAEVIALVGPNGAGKSTLLKMIVGLTAPTSGTVAVLDGLPAGCPAALDGIAFVAQDAPLYHQLSAADMIHLTRNLNRGFDSAYARKRLAELGIAPHVKSGKLSGGQQAQLSLSLALARHPRLLVLDEPTASLDPVARHDFMAAAMTAMAEEGVSVLLSSHVLPALERVAEHLVLLRQGQVRVCGPVDELLERHRFVTLARDRSPDPRCRVVHRTVSDAQQHLLVEMDPGTPLRFAAQSRAVSLEELSLAYLRGDSAEAPTLEVVP
ncbi:MAG TPA: ABC transporter ATP-binding protein [Flexivirga sp.]|uniref:ABC transporter ATP-binding protein n=1 Tax=Flexivirga sp. TaxID=1962927 RepID=UPI002BE558F0|nr:ABC transporter ATP-binding protein [Flexivirga sp.]HWC23301.1 ABC transporter ATP-binding protein [Flexivirga sp.]